MTDFNVRLAIDNPSDLGLSVSLVAPDGRELPLADAGSFGTGLGVGAGDTIFGTTFDQEAITPFGAGTAPFIGNFQPVYQIPPTAPTLSSTFNLSDFYGKDASGIAGTWYIRVRTSDTLFDLTKPAVLREGSLVFTSGMKPGVDTIVTTTLVNGTNTFDGPASGAKNPYPLSQAGAPVQFDRGVGPAPSIAADNTLGSFIDHSGRIYVAYTDYLRSPTNPNRSLSTRLKSTTPMFSCGTPTTVVRRGRIR